MTNDKPAREFKIGKHTVIVDEEMIPILAKFTWCAVKSKSTFYASTSVCVAGKRRSLLMHRLLTGMSSSIVDHKNRNGLDNRLENLRFASKSQNSQNRVRKNRFGYRGVWKPSHSPHFAFQIAAGKKKRSKYGFKTAEEAARAYDEASKELHGEFGIRNFKD